MATSDEEFLEELRTAFQIEAGEHLQITANSLLELEADPERASSPLLESIYREVHSLKGAARAVDASAIERVCQALEDLLSDWKFGALPPHANHFDPVHRALDIIAELLDRSTAPVADSRISQI